MKDNYFKALLILAALGLLAGFWGLINLAVYGKAQGTVGSIEMVK